MKNDERQKKYLLILLLTAVVFSVAAFLLPLNKSGLFWIAYIFEIIAILLQIPVFKLAFDNAETLRSKFLGFPVFRVGYLYTTKLRISRRQSSYISMHYMFDDDPDQL